MSKRGAAIVGACAIAGSLTMAFEGLRTKPYPDPGNPRVLTVCYGETERAMREYTPEECRILLNFRQRQDYAPAVLKCVPGFIDPKRRNAFAASIDASYNAGYNAFCRSPMARKFNAGDWAGGCTEFITLGKDGKPIRGWFYGTVSKKPVRSAWYSYVIKSGPNKGKYHNVFKGLVRRRAAEKALCLKGLA